MADRRAAGGRAAVAARQGLIGRNDLVAALGRAAGKRVRVISAPAGSGRRLCCTRGPAGRARAEELSVSESPGRGGAASTPSRGSCLR
jgi:hypothetical protein